jgi:Tryptophan-rich Synechocystis species C-terminal domain/Subtilase family
MTLRFVPQDWLDSALDAAGAAATLDSAPATGSDGAGLSPETSVIPAAAGEDAGSVVIPNVSDDDAPVQQANASDWMFDDLLDVTAPRDSAGIPTAAALPTPTSVEAAAVWANPAFGPTAIHLADAGAGFGGGAQAPADLPSFHIGLSIAAPAESGEHPAVAVAVHAAAAEAPATSSAFLENSAAGSSGAITDAGVGSGGATAAQVQQALDESGLSVNGSGIKVGVLSDSFNELGGAAADEADGALPSASNIEVLKDDAPGGADEGRAMMQIIHDIAPGASEAFYTAFDSEQDFANGILALAAAGCKVIVDDVGYSDEPYFQNGVIAQAIQTVEAEGVTYVTAAGNEGSNGYQANWTPISGTFDGRILTDAESFNGSLVQTVTINTEGTGDSVPLVLEWNQAYGAATADLELLIFHNGTLVATATNRTNGEPTNPYVEYDFATSGTYQVAVENLSGPNPGLIKEITWGDGLPATISGANTGTVVGHSMTPGAITAGAVSAADTPAFGFSPQSESFSSSGAGTELLFANNGTALSSPDLLNPVAVSGVDDIATTVTGELADFYGTSAASASLAGVAALILSANPNLTPAQVEQIMEETALPMSNSAVSGAGLVQVDQAVAAAESLASVVIRTDGTTSLVREDNDYFLDNTGTGTGPELKFQGAPITVGEWGGWEPIGAVATSNGYMVAWELPGATQSANEYTVWNTDTNGNDTTTIVSSVSGTNATLESLETSFGQDLNGDGTIGVPATIVIRTDGSTSLVQTGNDYFLDNTTTGTGPELKFQGAPITVGEWGGWEPIGAVATSNGYMVAWELPGATQSANEYTVWNTDTNGNDTTTIISSVSGTNTTLESLETSFGQDLNGDGTIGVPGAVVIRTDGLTSLVQNGNDYFLDNTTTGTGPELKFQGAPITVGEWGGWEPIGAVATSNGYMVAWELPGATQSANEYTVWNTDTNGNDTTTIVSSVAGTNTTLESIETSFGQDLNGDGTIGIPAGQTTGGVASPSVPQTSAVTVVSSDTFVFGSHGRAGGVTESPGAAGIHLDAFSPAPANPYAALFQPPPSGQPPAPFYWASDGNDAVNIPGHHESMAQINAQIADLHAGLLIH